MKTDVIEFLQHSALRNALFENDILILEGGGDRVAFDFVEFDRVSTLMRDYRLDEAGVKIDIRSIAKTNKIGRMLGEDWEASRVGRFIVLTYDHDSRALLLKL